MSPTPTAHLADLLRLAATELATVAAIAAVSYDRDRLAALAGQLRAEADRLAETALAE